MRDFLEQNAAPNGDLTLISGCALGIDQMWMEVGLFLKIPVIAAVPFKGFERKWPVASQQKLEILLAQCSEVVYVCEPGYAPAKLQQRNEWMVSECDALRAYWNGTPSGTKNCVDYAERLGVQVTIVNPEKLKP